MPSPPKTTSFPRRLDPNTWRACAGACVRIPSLRSRVFYFPQGHLEQQFFSGSTSADEDARRPLSLTSLILCDPRFVGLAVLPCVVSSVDFMVDSDTDEVFVRFGLRPDTGGGCPRDGNFVGEGSDCFTIEDMMLRYAKTLTPSDANNGGGFSVPRYCADAIFPGLDFKVDPPVQVLAVMDTNGTVWNFRHIYRGTPRRHLLTTGWSKFVNSKKLAAGDTVIFIRDAASTTEEMSVGIRRASRASGAAQCARWRQMIGGEGNGSSDKEESSPDGLFRDAKGKEEEVASAMEKWMAGEEFEVVYYPTRIPGGGIGTAAEFVIRREAVEEATRTFWGGGTRIKMVLESEDCSRVTSLQGTVSRIEIPQEGTWQGSPWRMLQITWDEPEAMTGKKYVSPWQVEVVANMPPLQPACYPAKFSFPVKSGLQTDGDLDFLYPWTRYSNMPMGQLNPPFVDYNTPFGIQGARQDDPRAVDALLHINGNAPMHMDNVIGNMSPKVDTISTDLNIASSQSEILLPDSPTESVQPFRGERVRRGAKAARVSGGRNGSFQLFGQIIHPMDPIEDTSAEVTGKESNGLKGPSGPGCTNPRLDLSLLTSLNGLNNGDSDIVSCRSVNKAQLGEVVAIGQMYR